MHFKIQCYFNAYFVVKSEEQHLLGTSLPVAFVNKLLIFGVIRVRLPAALHYSESKVLS